MLTAMITNMPNMMKLVICPDLELRVLVLGIYHFPVFGYL